jgi:hypothetical protein
MIFTNYKELHGYDVLTFKTDGGLELDLFYKDNESHSIEDGHGVLAGWDNKTTLSNMYACHGGKMYTLLHVLNAGELALPDIKAEDEQDAKEHDNQVKSMSNKGRYI